MALQAQYSANVYKFDFKKLKPFVQIFETESYNTENSNYGYCVGRAHLGLQYQFNEKWKAKIIIDRGRPASFGKTTVVDSYGNPSTVKNTSKERAYYTMFLKFASLQWKVNENIVA